MASASLPHAFTLIELLAVVTMMVLLVGLIVAAATYLERKVKKSEATSLMAVLESACESYRMDTGRYPTSSVYRFGGSYYLYEATQTNQYYVGSLHWDTVNNEMLYQQLCGGGKQYLRLPKAYIGVVGPVQWDPPTCETAAGAWYNNGWQNFYQPHTNLLDPWGYGFHYYRSAPPELTSRTNLQYRGACGPYASQSSTGSPPVTYTSYVTAYWMNTAVIGPQINASSYDLWSIGPNHANEFGAGDDISNFRINVRY